MSIQPARLVRSRRTTGHRDPFSLIDGITKEGGIAVLRSRHFIASLIVGCVCVVCPGLYVGVSPPASASTNVPAVHAASRGSSHAKLVTCGDSAAAVADITYVGGIYGITQLSYDSCTRDAWAYGHSTYLTCQGPTTFYGCVTELFYRTPGILKGSCTSGHTGQPEQTCNSGEASDATVTSFTYGRVNFVDNPTTFYATGQTTPV
jgi:hypothetical protein